MVIRPLAKVELRPPSPPILGGEYIQSPPELGDLGGIPAFRQEVYWLLVIGKNFRDIYSALSNSMTLTNHPMTAEETSKR